MPKIGIALPPDARNYKQLRAAFETFDMNGDGSMDRDEMAYVLESCGVFDNVDAVMKETKNKDGVIDVDDFIHRIPTELAKKLEDGFKEHNTKKMLEAFAKWDYDEDRNLDREEFAGVFKTLGLKDVNVDDFIDDMLGDDGKVRVKEFVRKCPDELGVAIEKALNAAKKADMAAIFAQFDVDNSGCLDRKELGHALKTLGLMAAFGNDVNTLFAKFAGGRGAKAQKIDCTVFVARMPMKMRDEIEKRVEASHKKHMEDLFHSFDEKGNGKLTEKEMSDIITELKVEGLSAEQALKDMAGPDGKVSVKDWMTKMPAQMVIAIEKGMKDAGVIANFSSIIEQVSTASKHRDGRKKGFCVAFCLPVKRQPSK